MDHSSLRLVAQVRMGWYLVLSICRMTILALVVCSTKNFISTACRISLTASVTISCLIRSFLSRMSIRLLLAMLLTLLVMYVIRIQSIMLRRVLLSMATEEPRILCFSSIFCCFSRMALQSLSLTDMLESWWKIMSTTSLETLLCDYSSAFLRRQTSRMGSFVIFLISQLVIFPREAEAISGLMGRALVQIQMRLGSNPSTHRSTHPYSTPFFLRNQSSFAMRYHTIFFLASFMTGSRNQQFGMVISRSKSQPCSLFLAYFYHWTFSSSSSKNSICWMDLWVRTQLPFPFTFFLRSRKKQLFTTFFSLENEIMLQIYLRVDRRTLWSQPMRYRSSFSRRQPYLRRSGEDWMTASAFSLWGIESPSSFLRGPGRGDSIYLFSLSRLLCSFFSVLNIFYFSLTQSLNFLEMTRPAFMVSSSSVGSLTFSHAIGMVWLCSGSSQGASTIL